MAHAHDTTFDAAMEGFGRHYFPGIPTTLAGLIESVGGKREAIKLIEVGSKTQKHTGVAPRTIERYLKAERGESGQTRPEGLARAKAQLTEILKQRQRDETPAKWRRRGMSVRFQGDFTTPSDPEEDRTINVSLTVDDVRKVVDAWEAHKWKEAASALNDAVFERYGLNGRANRRYGGYDVDNGFRLTHVDSLTII